MSTSPPRNGYQDQDDKIKVEMIRYDLRLEKSGSGDGEHRPALEMLRRQDPAVVTRRARDRLQLRCFGLSVKREEEEMSRLDWLRSSPKWCHHSRVELPTTPGFAWEPSRCLPRCLLVVVDRVVGSFRVR